MSAREERKSAGKRKCGSGGNEGDDEDASKKKLKAKEADSMQEPSGNAGNSTKDELIQQLEEKWMTAQARVKELEAILAEKEKQLKVKEEGEGKARNSLKKIHAHLEAATNEAKKLACRGDDPPGDDVPGDDAPGDDAPGDDAHAAVSKCEDIDSNEYIAPPMPKYVRRQNEDYLFKNPFSFPRLLVDAMPERSNKKEDKFETMYKQGALNITYGIMKTAFDMVPTDESNKIIHPSYFGIQPNNKTYVVQGYLDKIQNTPDNDLVTLDEEDVIKDGPGGAPRAGQIVVRKLTGDVAIHVPQFVKCVSLVVSSFPDIRRAATSEFEDDSQKIKPVVDALRRALVDGLWPEFFHATISTKGVWARRFHSDRSLGMKVCLKAVVQRAILKAEPRASTDLVDAVEALFKESILDKFADFNQNQFKCIMARAVQYGFKLCYRKQPSQDEVKKFAVLPTKAKIKKENGFDDGAVAFLLNRAHLYLAVAGDPVAKDNFEKCVETHPQEQFLTDSQLKRRDMMKTEQKSLRKQQQRQELYDVYEESEIEEEYIGVEDQKERDPLALSEKDPNDVVTENKSKDDAKRKKKKREERLDEVLEKADEEEKMEEKLKKQSRQTAKSRERGGGHRSSLIRNPPPSKIVTTAEGNRMNAANAHDEEEPENMEEEKSADKHEEGSGSNDNEDGKVDEDNCEENEKKERKTHEEMRESAEMVKEKALKIDEEEKEEEVIEKEQENPNEKPKEKTNGEKTGRLKDEQSKRKSHEVREIDKKKAVREEISQKKRPEKSVEQTTDKKKVDTEKAEKIPDKKQETGNQTKRKLEEEKQTMQSKRSKNEQEPVYKKKKQQLVLSEDEADEEDEDVDEDEEDEDNVESIGIDSIPMTRNRKKRLRKLKPRTAKGTTAVVKQAARGQKKKQESSSSSDENEGKQRKVADSVPKKVEKVDDKSRKEIKTQSTTGGRQHVSVLTLPQVKVEPLLPSVNEQKRKLGKALPSGRFEHIYSSSDEDTKGNESGGGEEKGEFVTQVGENKQKIKQEKVDSSESEGNSESSSKEEIDISVTRPPASQFADKEEEPFDS